MIPFTRRDFLKLSGVALLSTAFSGFNMQSADLTPPPIVYHGSRSHHYVALTYDDCWHADVLEQLNDMVAPYPGFHFTFFAVGQAIQNCEIADPGIWRRLYNRGHEIGYHTMQHIDTNLMSTKAMLADFDQWNNVLHQVLGFLPEVHFAKSPFNDVSPSFEDLCSERGLVDTRYSIGYEGQSAEDGLNAATRTQNGDIVQMHTFQDPAKGRQDVAISAKVIPYLAGQGFSLVTMTQLYDDLLWEQNGSSGCETGAGNSLTRTCLE